MLFASNRSSLGNGASSGAGNGAGFSKSLNQNRPMSSLNIYQCITNIMNNGGGSKSHDRQSLVTLNTPKVDQPQFGGHLQPPAISAFLTVHHQAPTLVPHNSLLKASGRNSTITSADIQSSGSSSSKNVELIELSDDDEVDNDL